MSRLHAVYTKACVAVPSHALQSWSASPTTMSSLLKCPTVHQDVHSRQHTLHVVLQIAGAAAAEGLSLKEVAAAASEAASLCRTVGVATHICTLPSAAPSDRCVKCLMVVL